MYSGIKSALCEEAGCIERTPLLVVLNDSSLSLPIKGRDRLGGCTLLYSTAASELVPSFQWHLHKPLFHPHPRKDVLEDTIGILVILSNITCFYSYFIQPVVSMSKDKLLVTNSLCIFP